MSEPTLEARLRELLPCLTHCCVMDADCPDPSHHDESCPAYYRTVVEAEIAKAREQALKDAASWVDGMKSP